MFIFGSIKLGIQTKQTERFINICKAKNISLKSVCTKEDGCSCIIEAREYKRVLDIADKTMATLKIEAEFGLFSLIKKYLKHKMFFVGIMIAYIMIKALSLYIWSIDFEGNLKYTDEALLKYLKDNGIKSGKYITDIDCDELESRIRLDFNDITWVSVEIKGTKLTVAIKENAYTNTFLKEYENCNIVADKDGVIESIVTRTGTAQVKAGDTVKKGDILVSGIVERYNDSKELIGTELVHADASIKVKAVHEIHETLPLYYMGKTYTGNEFKQYSIFPSKKMKKEYEFYDIITEEKRFFSIKTYKEYVLSEEKYDMDTAKRLLNEKINEYFANLEQFGVVIVEKNVTIDIYKNEYIAVGYIDTIEPIGVAEEILIE